MKCFLLLVALIVVGCNEKKKSSPVNESVPADLGTYKNCVNDDDTSVRTVVVLGEQTVTALLTGYVGKNCPAGSEFFDEVDSYSYTSSGTEITLSIESITFMPRLLAFVNELNSDSFCGFTNWGVNTPKRVIGVNCGGTVINAGDTEVVTAFKSGSSLVMKQNGESEKYALVKKLNYVANNDAITNGYYGYFDGQTGIHVQWNSSTMNLYVFDPGTLKYYIKNFSYTKSNNIATMTYVSSTPAGCNADATPFTQKLIPTDFSLGIENDSGQAFIPFEKLLYDATTFRTTHLPSGAYSTGCF